MSNLTTPLDPAVRNNAVPGSVRLLTSGIPGLQYVIVDPDAQYQKFEIVLFQAPSGTDPRHPPDFNARLTDHGKVLKVSISVTPVLADKALLVDKKASWMRDESGGGWYSYENRKQTRLGGLGPTIAQINSFFCNQPWRTAWKIPLSEVCDEIIGGYSICNFPPQHTYGPTAHQFYPVIVEFKLKTVEQSVKWETKITAGLWAEGGYNSNNNSADEDERTGGKRARKSSGRSKSSTKRGHKDP